MTRALRDYLVFLRRCGRIAFVGDWRYYLWMGVLTVFCLLGLNAYAKQLVNGLITTGMSDQVSWGVYIANFTFLVGVAAAAVMMVIPVYIYDNEELHDLVIFGELLAVAAILMCLAFVTVDLGRPDRSLDGVDELAGLGSTKPLAAGVLAICSSRDQAAWFGKPSRAASQTILASTLSTLNGGLAITKSHLQ